MFSSSRVRAWFGCWCDEATSTDKNSQGQRKSQYRRTTDVQRRTQSPVGSNGMERKKTTGWKRGRNRTYASPTPCRGPPWNLLITADQHDTGLRLHTDKQERRSRASKTGTWLSSRIAIEPCGVHLCGRMSGCVSGHG